MSWDFALHCQPVSEFSCGGRAREACPRSTHPDVVRVQPSRVLGHVLGQVRVLQEMGERLLLVVLAQRPAADRTFDCQRSYKVQVFENKGQKAHSQVF